MLTSQLERISFTLTDAAEVSGISKRQLWRLIKAGQLQVAHIGRRVIVPKESLVSLISANLVRGVSA
jgi:excisionase family DNA binding protein